MSSASQAFDMKSYFATETILAETFGLAFIGKSTTITDPEWYKSRYGSNWFSEYSSAHLRTLQVENPGLEFGKVCSRCAQRHRPPYPVSELGNIGVVIAGSGTFNVVYAMASDTHFYYGSNVICWSQVRPLVFRLFESDGFINFNYTVFEGQVRRARQPLQKNVSARPIPLTKLYGTEALSVASEEDLYPTSVINDELLADAERIGMENWRANSRGLYDSSFLNYLLRFKRILVDDDFVIRQQTPSFVSSSVANLEFLGKQDDSYCDCTDKEEQPNYAHGDACFEDSYVTTPCLECKLKIKRFWVDEPVTRSSALVEERWRESRAVLDIVGMERRFRSDKFIQAIEKVRPGGHPVGVLTTVACRRILGDDDLGVDTTIGLRLDFEKMCQLRNLGIKAVKPGWSVTFAAWFMDPRNGLLRTLHLLWGIPVTYAFARVIRNDVKMLFRRGHEYAFEWIVSLFILIFTYFGMSGFFYYFVRNLFRFVCMIIWFIIVVPWEAWYDKNYIGYA